jgi:phosphoketolase
MSDELKLLDAYWRAANYLSVGQIYLLDNPLLREPLMPEHIKPRLLGHWGTTPGLNLIYAHMNRVIRARDLNALYVTGPGHGGPGLVANAYLEGTYSEIYSSVGEDVDGMRGAVSPALLPRRHPQPVGARKPAHVMRPADVRGGGRRGGHVVGPCGSRSAHGGGVAVGEQPAPGCGADGDRCSGAGTLVARLRRVDG